MNTHWNIIEVTGGKVLPAHDVLTAHDIPCLAFVEIKRRTPRGRKKEKRGKLEAYPVSAFTRYLFADLSAVDSLLTLSHVMARKTYIKGVMGRGEALYAIKDAEFDGLRSIMHETGKRKGKAQYPEYSREAHSRMNLNRIYGQSVNVPVFTEGDRVSFVKGGLQGLIYEVEGFGADGRIKMRGEEAFFGGVNLVEVLDPYMLERVA